MSAYSKTVVGVIGASGFIGQHLLAALTPNTNVEVRLLQHRRHVVQADCVIFSGDVHRDGSLGDFMAGCHVLINLAHPVIDADDGRYEQAMSNIARSARTAGVKRVIHLSTAMVAGTPHTSVIDENTMGSIHTLYERHKRAAEAIFLADLAGVADVGILRPTAVFGAGGLNLMKLAREIQDAPAWRRHVLRAIHGRRHMHLVSIQDVASAIVFLAFAERPLAGNAFIVSSDEHPQNNYQAVDSMLGEVLGKTAPQHSWCVPPTLLHVLLAVLRKPQADPTLVFSSTKLTDWGWRTSSDFTADVKAFGQAIYAGDVGQ